MAIVRPEFTTDGIRVLLGLFPAKVDRVAQRELFRVRRELQRALARGEEMEANERAQVRKMRAARRVPGYDEDPLISNETLRRPHPRPDAA